MSDSKPALACGFIREGAFGIVDYVKPKGAERIVVCGNCYYFTINVVILCVFSPCHDMFVVAKSPLSILPRWIIWVFNGLLSFEATSRRPTPVCWPRVPRATACSSNLALVPKHRPMENGDRNLLAKKETKVTPRKINMEPENTPLEEDNHLPNHHFQVLC